MVRKGSFDITYENPLGFFNHLGQHLLNWIGRCVSLPLWATAAKEYRIIGALCPVDVLWRVKGSFDIGAVEVDIGAFRSIDELSREAKHVPQEWTGLLNPLLTDENDFLTTPRVFSPV